MASKEIRPAMRFVAIGKDGMSSLSISVVWRSFHPTTRAFCARY